MLLQGSNMIISFTILGHLTYGKRSVNHYDLGGNLRMVKINRVSSEDLFCIINRIFHFKVVQEKADR
jgi:hypothetical protein